MAATAPSTCDNHRRPSLGAFTQRPAPHQPLPFSTPRPRPLPPHAAKCIGTYSPDAPDCGSQCPCSERPTASRSSRARAYRASTAAWLVPSIAVAGRAAALPACEHADPQRQPPKAMRRAASIPATAPVRREAVTPAAARPTIAFVTRGCAVPLPRTYPAAADFYSRRQHALDDGECESREDRRITTTRRCRG